MKIAISAHYSSGTIRDQVPYLQEMEKAGVDHIWVAESYSFDAFTALGYLAATLHHATLAPGIVNIYSRTPTALAMSAAGLDALSQGRAMLGLGASGPQVIEGFHGVPYDAPMTRLRETMEICRSIWKREKLEYQGRKFEMPLSEDRGGGGLGKPLKLINKPVRDTIPIALATLGAKSVEMTAELADAWLPAFYMVDEADAVWGEALKRGLAKRDPGLPPLEVFAGGTVAIGNGLEAQREAARPQVALYVGGMGARDKNFYNQIFRKYGFEDEATVIQDLYLSGRKSEAEAAVPERYLEATSLIGDEGFVRERLARYREAGVTTLNAAFRGTGTRERVEQCDALRNLMEKI